MGRYRDSSEIMDQFDSFLDAQTPLNVLVDPYGENVSGASRYFRPRDYFEVPVVPSDFYPDEPSSDTIVVCYDYSFKSPSGCRLYHFSWAVERVENSAASVAVDCMAVSFPLQGQSLVSIISSAGD